MMQQRLAWIAAVTMFAASGACGDDFEAREPTSSTGTTLPSGVGGSAAGGGDGGGGSGGSGAAGGGCGDGTKAGDEACDGRDFGEATCNSAGDFVSGVLGCTAGCDLDTSACQGPPEAPRPRLPMNNDYVGSVHTPGSLRPRFVWTEVTIDMPDLPLTYEITLANDAAMADVLQSESVDEPEWQPDDDLPASSAVPVGARYYWNVRACVGSVCSEPSKTWSVRIGRQKQDVNGDGYAEMFTGGVGYAYHDGYLFFGSPTGFGTPIRMPDVTGKFIGDVDDDGFGDLATQRLESDRVRVWRGAAGTGISSGTPVEPEGSNLAGYAGVGDVNGDFYDDFAVGEDYANGESGRVSVCFGGAGQFDGTPDVVLDGTPGDHLGVSVDGIDIDGDGLSDILAGAPTDPSAPVGPGKVYVTLGAENISGPAAMTLAGQSDGSQFGHLVAAAGDMNGDGLGDFAVVAPEAAGGTSSEISLFLGAVGNLGVPLKFSGAAAASFGNCAVGGGDLESDGFDDLLVCAPDAASGDGELYIVRGAAMSTEIAIELLESGTVADANYARAASFVDDFNGDAKDDVVVGADVGNSGTVFLYYGGLASLVESDTAVGAGLSERVGAWVD